MKKRLLSLALAFVLAFSLLPATAFAAEAEEISTAKEFADMKQAGNYILTKDITVSTPYANDFSGTFDGNGHTITLNITADYAANNGLFKQLVGGATVKNLRLTGSVTQTKKKSGTAALAGKANSYASDILVENCSADVTVSGYSKVGGLLGDVTSSQNSVTVRSCANLGTVTGQNNGVGGIVGQSSGAGCAISACYNRGDITGYTYVGGIVGQCASAVKWSYSTGSTTATTPYTVVSKGDIYGGGNGASDENCYQLASTSDEGVTALIGSSKFAADTEKINDGYPILPWQKTSGGGEPEPPTPGISISGNQTLWTVAGGKNVTQTTLTVSYADMGDKKPAVTWGYPAESDAAAFAEADGALVVDALGKTGGTEKVTASVQYNENTYKAECTITVIPYITSVDIVNPENGVIALGQTVEAKVLVGDLPYDEENYPKLTYQWYRYNVRAGKSEAIPSATNRTFEIKEDQFGGEDQKYKIGVNVACNGETVHSYDDGQQSVRSAEFGKLYPVAYDEEFTLPSEIKEDTKLELPTERTKGDIKAGIEWSGFNDVIAEDGTVTRPADGKSTVTLKAKFTYGNAYANRTFEITVWSQAAVDAEGDSEKIEAAIGKLSTLQPQFGKDSNVQTMVETRLAKEFPDVGVKYTGKTPMSATENEAHSDISDNGNITYFYDDPNKTVNERTQWFDTYKAYFTLTCGSETQENVAVPVTVYWDEARVKDAMCEEILSRVVLPETVEANLDLPKVVDGKKWTLIEWTSSDRAITISTEKQGTADTLFDPYVGVVTRQTLDQQVELTAKFTFQLADQQIVLYKVFYVTVKGDPNADNRSTLYQNKLDEALTAHLTDAVTGEALDKANVVNDIQFPTTRDLKIDGKYTPVVITSSDPGVIEAPTTPNSARVWVYRPLPGESAKTVTLTVKILDRPNGPQPGDDLSAMRGVLASEEIKVTVQPLKQTEIDAEVALMELVKVKVNYWNGIRNANTDQNNVTTDLHAFQECYLNDNGELTWVYDREDLKNHGIVPVPLDNWYDQQIWRLFRSSNAEVVAHENLLVTRQEESKAVTITSYLSSETLGRYAEKYPQNADFQKLYKQPVTIDLVVTGTQYAQGVSNTVRMQAAKRALAVRPTVTVSFSLTGRGMGFTESNLEYAEGSTVYDVFSDRLAEHGYTCKRRGSYIAAITSDSGVTLEEFDEGKNSGWMYRVNGELVGRYMSAQGLEDGDSIELYFTSDWTSEPGAEGWQKPGKIETIVNADGSVTKIETKSDGTVIETTTWRDGSTLTAETSPNGRVETVEKRADGTTVETVEPVSGGITASVSVPKSVGSTRVDIPVSKPTGSMVAVIVHPDGTEEIVKGSIMTETGVALRAEGDVRLKIIDNAKRFNDMADHWAKDAVEFASSRELFNGVGNDAFGPDLSMTRGMVSTVLARLAGADTAGGETWYAKGMVWAVENGISDGTAPEQPVTREQLAAMLYRYAGSPAVSGELGFDDADSISAWARDAVRWCVDNGILNGVGGNRMTPQDIARRGQVAAMLMRFLQATV